MIVAISISPSGAADETGSVSAADWSGIRLLALALLVLLPAVVVSAHSLPVLELGPDLATALGMPARRGDLALVGDALDLSHRTVRKIRQNLFWAFAYNVIGIPLAAAGLLNPVVAGAAMALSSVSVVSNALLLRGWRR